MLTKEQEAALEMVLGDPRLIDEVKKAVSIPGNNLNQKGFIQKRAAPASSSTYMRLKQAGAQLSARAAGVRPVGKVTKAVPHPSLQVTFGFTDKEG